MRITHETGRIVVAGCLCITEGLQDRIRLNDLVFQVLYTRRQVGVNKRMNATRTQHKHTHTQSELVTEKERTSFVNYSIDTSTLLFIPCDPVILTGLLSSPFFLEAPTLAK